MQTSDAFCRRRPIFKTARRQKAGIKMKKIIYTFILLTLCPTLRAADDGATGIAVLRVFSPMRVEGTQTLNFGNIMAGAGGTVTIAPTGGAPSYTGGVGLSGVSSPGALELSGAPNTPIISVLAPDTLLELQGGGAAAPMPLSISTSCPAGAACALDGIGALEVGFGGTLTVAPSQPGGVYEGVINFTITY